ncbi:hemerythrin domain-containing protein [Lignipirellula cremea]|uniref:Hemerythrin-like domain-containing protein n=1 Tax=Lignipirellula cremea TaxID=2528010 RepID=A0A518DW19_9BACT|nr:hemerythrin domain-containing protein [Lignipirellula cremea]QDU96029.1 hypothetical protein Pla8534_38480 [Lignipirellula cremea]
MANVLGTVSVNAAFLQEIKEDNAELRRDFSDTAELFSRLGESVVEPQQISDSATRLRDQIAMHFALEEFFGYVDVATETAPRLYDRAENLRAEHEVLYLQICDLVERIERWVYREPQADGAAVLADGFIEFHTRFAQHENAENELILDAMDSDIGVGD